MFPGGRDTDAIVLNKRNRDGVLTADGTYRTRFGPCVRHSGHIFANTAVNIRYGFRRIAGLRFPEHPGLHQLFLSNQSTFIATHSHFLHCLRIHNSPAYDSYLGWYEEARLHHSDPHPKRLLRIRAWEEIHNQGKESERLWLKQAVYKIKRNEIAKSGKYVRMIADLGVPASLQGFRVTYFLKEAMSRPFEYAGGTFQFVKTPTTSVLRDVFSKLQDPPGRFYFVYFSDDSCLSIRHGGRVYIYNVDISKCDASHGDDLFSAYTTIVPDRASSDLKLLVDQLNVPLIVRNPLDPKQKIKCRSLRTRLLSGSTITTTLNNLASLLIGLAIVEVFDGTETSISHGARQAGYKVTVETCLRPEDIQFLKNSPVRDINGVYQPVLNVGVLLRASGVCRGDLPGSARDSLCSRAKTFQQALLTGMYPRTNTPLLSNFRTACKTTRTLSDHDFQRLIHATVAYKHEHNEEDTFTFHTEDFLRRYNLTSLEVAQLFEFSTLGFGQFAANAGLSSVLNRDYDGLTAPVP